MNKYKVNGVYVSNSPYCNGETIRVTGLGEGIVYYTILNGNYEGETGYFCLGTFYDNSLKPIKEEISMSKYKIGERYVSNDPFCFGEIIRIVDLYTKVVYYEILNGDYEYEKHCFYLGSYYDKSLQLYVEDSDSMRAKNEFKIGDRVRIRAWNDMEREYGITANKDIKVPHYLFCAEMKHLCGTTAIVKKIEDDRIYLEGDKHERANWFYTADMLELVKNRKEMFESRCKVRFRSWEDMKEEFGLTPWGDIDTPVYCFRKEMGVLCGTNAIISKIEDNVITLKGFKYENDDIWTYTLDMVEMIEKVREFKVGQIYKVDYKSSKEHNEIIQISTVSDFTVYYNSLTTTSKGEKYWKRNVVYETHYFDCFNAYSEFADNLILLTDVIEVPVQVDFELDLNETKKDRFKIGRKFRCNNPKFNFYNKVIQVVEVQKTYFLYKIMGDEGSNRMMLFDDPFLDSLEPYVVEKKNYNFKIGDLVRVRQWKDMAEEFGMDSFDAIQLKYSFPPEMRYLCGCVAVVEEINDENADEGEVELIFTDGVNSSTWMFCLDMLEPLAPEELLNIKVVCLSDEFPEYWTKGYEYYFINGRITNDKGEESRQYRSLDEFFEGYDVKLVEILNRPTIN